MENWVFDSSSNCYYYYYGSSIIAIIYSNEEYFFLELLPPFIHEKIVLHYKDKENVFDEANQYLNDVIRDTIDKFIYLNKYGIDCYFKLQDFIKENNYVNHDKSAYRKLVEEYVGGKGNGTN